MIQPVPAIASSVEGIRAMLQCTPLDAFVFRSTFGVQVEVVRFQETWNIEMSDSKKQTDNKNLSMKCWQSAAVILPCSRTKKIQ